MAKRAWLVGGAAATTAALVMVCAADLGGLGQHNTKLTASDGALNDYFGWQVAFSNLVAVIGAPFDDDLGDNSGAAYTFRWDGDSWNEEHKFLASDGEAEDRFGSDVAVSGDAALIGAAGHIFATGPGSAYVFRYNGTAWSQEQQLVPSDGQIQDFFGNAVSLNGNVALIGAIYSDDNGPSSGAAYVFRYDGTTWIEEQKLLASDGELVDLFGASVAVSRDVAVVGAIWDDDNGDRSGSAYVFRYDGATWTQEAKLLASDGDVDDHFGSRVAVDGNRVLVGVLSDDDFGESSGSAYVFRNEDQTWIQEQKLLPSDPQDLDRFGSSVWVNGQMIVVGASGNDPGGAAYVFRLEGSWFEDEKLVAPDAGFNDHLGSSVAAVPGAVLIGAPRDNIVLDDEGSAYVFGIPCPADCADNDGVVGISDFLELLSQWTLVGSSCDLDGSGVGINAFLDLLSNWGPCP